MEEKQKELKEVVRKALNAYLERNYDIFHPADDMLWSEKFTLTLHVEYGHCFKEVINVNNP